jgi:hypothetical protein
MTYSLHPGAEQDIADALDFYAEQAGTLVAERFLNESSESPNSWPNIRTLARQPRKAVGYFPCGSFHTRLSTEALMPVFESLSFVISIESRITVASGVRFCNVGAPANDAQRLRLDRDRAASHDLNRLLDRPGESRYSSLEIPF